MGTSKGSQDSRQVLHQAHGLPAVIEGILVGGEEDIPAFEDELDAHVNMVCRIQVGTGSGRARAEGWNWASSRAQPREGLFWGHGIQYGYCSLRSAGLLHACQICSSNLGFGVSSQGWGSSFSPGRGCFRTLSLFLQALRAVEAPLSLSGKASRSLLTSHHGLMALLPPTLKGQTDIARVLAQIEAFSLRRQLQLPQTGYSSEEGCLCK